MGAVVEKVGAGEVEFPAVEGAVQEHQAEVAAVGWKVGDEKIDHLVESDLAVVRGMLAVECPA